MNGSENMKDSRVNVFSVIIPVYNKAAHIERSINSVLNQSFLDYELIIVDDHSTDDSCLIIEKLIKNHDHCRLVRRNKGLRGPAAARNCGVQEARGEWVAFLDADDEWESFLLDEFLALMEKYPESSFLATAQKRVASDDSLSEDPYSRLSGRKGYCQFDLLHYIRVSSRNMNPIQTSSVAVKTELLRNVGGFPEGTSCRGEDKDTWFRLLFHTTLAWSPKKSATYFRNSENMVTMNEEPEFTSYVDRTYKEVLKDKRFKSTWGNGINHEIKKLSNSEKYSIFKKRIRSGTLKTVELKYFYFSANPFFYSFFFFWSLIPQRIQKSIAHLLFKKRTSST